jgi:hypothetical protein
LWKGKDSTSTICFLATRFEILQKVTECKKKRVLTEENSQFKLDFIKCNK